MVAGQGSRAELEDRSSGPGRPDSLKLRNLGQHAATSDPLVLAFGCAYVASGIGHHVWELVV